MTPDEYNPNSPTLRTWPKWFSDMLRVGGIGGMAVSLAAFVVIPLIAPNAIGMLQGSAKSTADQITEFAGAIDLANAALKSSAKTLGDVSGILSTTNLFVEDSVGLLESIGAILGEKAPNTIESTQQALEAAHEGAKAIDSTLSAMSRIEFLTGVSYDPEDSLSKSLQEVAQSLDPLPDALREVQGDIENSASSLDALRPRFALVASDLVAFSENTVTVAEDLEKRGEELLDIARQVEEFSTKINTWIWGAAGLLMLLTLGMTISQAAVYVVGTNMVIHKESNGALKVDDGNGVY